MDNTPSNKSGSQELTIPMLNHHNRIGNLSNRDLTIGMDASEDSGNVG